MKQLTVLLLPFFIFQNLMAQEESKPSLKNGFYISIPSLFVSTTQLSYEREFENNNSLMICPRLTYKRRGNTSRVDVFGVGIELQYRLDITGQSEDKDFTYYVRQTKVYFSPFVTYDYLKVYNI